MFFGHINHVDFRQYPAAIGRALRYLQETDLAAIPAGRYDLEPEKMYVQVLDLTTKPDEEILPEVHRNWIDVQFLQSGVEKIAVSVDQGKYQVATPYDAERDIAFYTQGENEAYLTFRAGNFAVFFPQDAHRPAIADGQPSAIRKVVVKVAVSLLDD
ncbi:hypothetical protein A4G20_10040 [Pasteurellaceae bacterium RH1A]|nr:hypothetical protein A4G20_10040 [Pasteurellaceae bacterium RH1A]